MTSVSAQGVAWMNSTSVASWRAAILSLRWGVEVAQGERPWLWDAGRESHYKWSSICSSSS